MKYSANSERLVRLGVLLTLLVLFSCATTEGNNYKTNRAKLESQLEIGINFTMVVAIVDAAGLKKEIWFNPGEPEQTTDQLDRKNWSAVITALVGVVPEVLTREKYVTCYFDSEHKLRKVDWWQYSRF